MRVKCTSSNRDMIIRVLQTETGALPVFGSAPGFRVQVGAFALLRDGHIVLGERRDGETGESGVLGDKSEHRHVLATLAELGLCDYSPDPLPASSVAICYPLEPHTGRSLLNLVSIVSARQALLNRALAARGRAFYVAPTLVNSLVAHPPLTPEEFFLALYARGDELRGIAFTRDRIELTGFERCPAEERHIQRQLADLVVATALSRQWIKPHTPNVRNKKYALRVWLNSMGMIGDDYAEARATMLSRVYGKSDQRRIPRGKGM